MTSPNVAEAQEKRLEDCEHLCLALYHFLWRKDVRGSSCPDVMVPDTILFSNSRAIVWYFTSVKEQKILKKRPKNTSGLAICNALTRDVRPPHLPCSYHLLPEAKQGMSGQLYKAEGGNSQSAVAYVSADQLTRFLRNEAQEPRGILQRFLLPAKECNTVLRATWSPQVCRLERRANKHKMGDTSVDMPRRLATFEGADWLSCDTTSGLEAGVQEKVREMCNSIVNHVFHVSFCQHRISQMLLYLKLDDKGRLWLLYCSSLKLTPLRLSSFIVQAFMRMVNRPAMDEQKPVVSPLELLRRTSDSEVLPGNQSETSTPEKSGKSVKVRRTKAPNRARGPLERSLRGEPRAMSPVPRSASGPSICAMCGVPHSAANLYKISFRSIVCRWESEALADPDELQRRARLAQVPPAIVRTMPLLSQQRYMQRRRDRDFLERMAEMCVSCLVKVVSTPDAFQMQGDFRTPCASLLNRGRSASPPRRPPQPSGSPASLSSPSSPRMGQLPAELLPASSQLPGGTALPAPMQPLPAEALETQAMAELGSMAKAVSLSSQQLMLQEQGPGAARGGRQAAATAAAAGARGASRTKGAMAGGWAPPVPELAVHVATEYTANPSGAAMWPEASAAGGPGAVAESVLPAQASAAALLDSADWEEMAMLREEVQHSFQDTQHLLLRANSLLGASAATAPLPELQRASCKPPAAAPRRRAKKGKAGGGATTAAPAGAPGGKASTQGSVPASSRPGSVQARRCTAQPASWAAAATPLPGLDAAAGLEHVPVVGQLTCTEQAVLALAFEELD